MITSRHRDGHCVRCVHCMSGVTACHTPNCSLPVCHRPRQGSTVLFRSAKTPHRVVRNISAYVLMFRGCREKLEQVEPAGHSYVGPCRVDHSRAPVVPMQDVRDCNVRWQSPWVLPEITGRKCDASPADEVGIGSGDTHSWMKEGEQGPSCSFTSCMPRS